nr:AMP-binding protein [Aquicoccus sp. G2-2]MEA1114881.1 AMP-binding protein [Aquicoccus sp. G2-2]
MQNLTAQLQYHARVRPEAEALIYGENRTSWSALDQRVRVVAGGLKARGIGPDSIVALFMKNSSAFIELLYAISHLGAVALPVNYRLSAEELAYITGHAGVDLLIGDEEFAAGFEDQPHEVILLDAVAQRDASAVLGGAAPVTRPHPRNSNDLMRLMYTSGTTDRPKGVTHSYENFHAKNMDMILALQLSAADRLCMVGPLYHVGACDLPGMALHTMGGTLVVLRDFDATQVVKTVADEQITGIWLPR